MNKPNIAASPSPETDSWKDGTFSRWLRMRPFVLGRGRADSTTIPQDDQGESRHRNGHARHLAIRQEAGRMVIGVACSSCGHVDFHPAPVPPAAR